MTKRDRELNQRLGELFSGESNSSPDEAAPIDAAGSAPPLEFMARTLEKLPPDLWKALLDQLPLPVYLKDHEHTWVAVNNACGDLLGRPAAALIGHVDKEQSDEAWQLDDQVLETNQPGDTQVLTTAPDGTIHLQRTRRVPLSIVDAQAHYVLGIIEELKPAPVEDGTVQPGAADPATSASAVDNSQLLRFQSIVEATPIPILITRAADGRLLYANLRASVIFGVAREDMLNHTSLEFYDDPADRQKILGVLQRDGRVSNYELRLKRGNGALMWAMLDAQPLVYNGEHAVLSIFYDITARKQAEEQLRQLSRAVEQSPASIVITDLTGAISYVNPKFSQLTGYSPAEVIGRNPRILKSGHTSPDEYARLWATLSAGQTWHGELLNKKKNGELYWELASISPITDVAGRVTHYLAVKEDVTERKQTEAALQRHDAYLAVLHETSLGLINRLDLTDLLTGIVTRATRLVDTPHGYLYLVNPEGTHLEVRVGTGIYADYLGYQLKPGEGLAGQVWQTGQPIGVDDYTLWPHRADGFAHSDFHAIAAVPLKSGAQVIGVIGVGQINAGVYFSDTDLEILSRFAELASIALDNAKLYQAAQQDIARRKQAEDQVQRYEFIANTATESMTLINRQHVFEAVNDAYCRAQGRSRAELIGHSLAEVWGEARYREKILPHLEQCFAGQIVRYEDTFPFEGGEPRYYEIGLYPYSAAPGGPVTYAVVVTFDITERKLAEDALRDSETLYQSLVEAIPENLCRKDQQGRFTYGNRRYCELVGLSLEELISKTDFDIHPPELAEKYRADDQAVMDSGKTVEFLEAHVVLGTGKQSFVRTIKNPLYDARGQVIGIQIMFWDATEQGRAERALRESEERYRDLFDTAGELIQGVAPDGKFIYVNRAWRRALGHTEEEVVSASAALSMFDIIHPDDRPHYTALFNRLMAGEQVGSLAARSRFVTKDGRIITVEGQLSATIDKEGHAIGARGIFRDVTEREQIEAERERLLAAEARRAVQLQTGGEIASAAASILDPDKLLPVVIELIRERYDLYYAGLFLIDAAGQWAELRAGAGEAGRAMLEAHHRLALSGASMIGQCAATGEARIALDVGAEAVRFDNPLLPRTRSEMALPLISRGRIIGALTIQSTQLAAFTPDDISALRTMAGQIATTIENARLFQETQRRAEEQAVLFDLAQALSAQLAVDQVLQQIYQGASRLIDTANFYIGLYDPARHAVDFAINASESAVDRNITTIPADQGLTGYILRTRRSVLIEEDVDRWLAEQGLARVGAAAQSWLGVPLLLGDQIMGVMAVQNHVTRHAYTEHDRDLLQVFGVQAAIAIQNARLFEQTRAARAAAESRLLESQVLQQFSRTVSSTLDIDHVLDALVETLQQRLNLPYIAISLIDHEARYLTTVRGIGIASILQGLTRPLDILQDDITMDIMRKGQIEVIDGWDDRFDRAIYERGGHAELVRAFVPVRLRDKTIGLFEAGYRRDTRPYISPEEVRMLGGLADQLAIAIDNARLLNQVQAALDETGRLYTASRQLAAAADIPGMLAAFAETAPVADINRVVLWLFDYDAADQLASATVAGAWYSGVGAPPPPVGVRFMPQMLRALKFVQSTEPLFLNDVNADSRTEPDMVAVLQQLKIQSIAVLPLWTGGRQLGLLMLQSERSHVFTDSETRLYVSLAQQMAIAIENRRLFEQTQRDAEREHTLNRIASRLRNAQSVEQVLNIATQELRAATRSSVSVAEIAPGDAQQTAAPANGNGSQPSQ